ncbi:MAG: hypothetical protein HY714_03610 [Candidatus Omnitrophica bacterium]|nr:hypothetical protein [Candidatus Omnitrophota bacterium]
MDQSAIVKEELTAEGRIHSHISWGAIVAGYILAAAFGFLFSVLGSAIGISGINLSEGQMSAGGLTLASVFWLFLTWVGCMFLGGLFAGFLAGEIDRLTGAVHGISVWALANVMALFFGTAGLMTVGQAAGQIGFGLAVSAPVAQQNEQRGERERSLGDRVQTQLKETMAQGVSAVSGDEVRRGEVREAIDRLDNATLVTISGELARGDQDRAKEILLDRTGLSESEADAIMQGVGAKVSRGAKTAANYTTAALWTLFFGSLLGLLAAYFGGTTGTQFVLNRHFAYASTWKHTNS